VAGLIIFVFQDIPPCVHVRAVEPIATCGALIYELEQAENGVQGRS
jgi:hypothetical protein